MQIKGIHLRILTSTPLAILSGCMGLAGLIACTPVMKLSQGTDPEAQLPFWEVANDILSIRIVQRLPDQTRGFFQARGFSVAEADLIADSCVFQTVLSNRATTTRPVTIEYDLQEWNVITPGDSGRLKTREYWKILWNEHRISIPAQLGFEWALLPTRQVYQPGDYNWGMTLYGLPPGTQFNLELVWYENGERRHARIDGLECAPDIHPTPEGS